MQMTQIRQKLQRGIPCYEGVDIVYIIARTHNVINIIIDEKKHQQFVDLNLYWI